MLDADVNEAKGENMMKVRQIEWGDLGIPELVPLMDGPALASKLHYQARAKDVEDDRVCY